jgi:hypothetical protein
LTLHSASDKVDAMRGSDRPSRRRVTLWRHTSLWLVASLVSLLSSQPFHERLSPEDSSRAATVVASDARSPSGPPSHSGAHDRDHCVLCRAVAQTRLGARAPAHESVLAAEGPMLALHPEAPACPRAAPEPCLAGPRAPPASRLA